MQAHWQRMNTWYSAMSLRERVLVGLSILIGVAVIWYVLLISPMLSTSHETRSQLGKLQDSLQALQQQQQALMQKQQQDPLRELKERVAQLNLQLAQADAQLKDKLHGLIVPQQMAKVLESVLQQHHDLALLKVQSLPATPLVPRRTESKDAEQDKAKRHGAEVYRHGLQLEFEGSYLATLAYLKALQTLPWGFYWDEVRLQVEKYPQAKVTIVVHTLSLTEGWIGV